jgi:hypothetical protein
MRVEEIEHATTCTQIASRILWNFQPYGKYLFVFKSIRAVEGSESKYGMDKMPEICSTPDRSCFIPIYKSRSIRKKPVL